MYNDLQECKRTDFDILKYKNQDTQNGNSVCRSIWV